MVMDSNTDVEAVGSVFDPQDYHEIIGELLGGELSAEDFSNRLAQIAKMLSEFYELYDGFTISGGEALTGDEADQARENRERITFVVRDGLQTVFWNLLQTGDMYISTSEGKDWPLSLSVFNILMVVLRDDASQVDFALQFLLDDRYDHKYTQVLCGVLSELVTLQPAALQNTEIGGLHIGPEHTWAAVDRPSQRMREVYEKYFTGDNTEDAELVRKALVTVAATVCDVDASDFMISVLSDGNESSAVKQAALLQMRHFVDFYGYSDAIRETLHSGVPALSNLAAGYVLDYVLSNTDAVAQVFNMGGVPSVDMFNDILRVVRALYVQLARRAGGDA